MNFTLYPYNMYILALAAAAVVITLATVGSSALRTLKVLKSLPLDQMKKLTSALKTKASVSGDVLKKTASGLKTVLAAAVILKALRKYSDENEHNTVRRVGKAASALIKDTRDNMQVLKAIRKSI